MIIGNTKEIVELVRTYQTHIGLIEGQTNEKELVVYPFMQDELVIVASNDHPLAHKQEVSINDLQNQLWITRELGSGTREYFNHFIRSNGLKVKSLIIISSNQGIKETLMHGNGLALLSRHVIEQELNHKTYRLFTLNILLLSNIFLSLFADNENNNLYTY